MHRHPVFDPRNGQNLLLDGIVARELRGIDDGVARDVGPQPRPQRREPFRPDDGRVGPQSARVPPRRARRKLALRLHPHFHEVGRARDADGERSRRESRDHFQAEAVGGGAGRVGDGALERVVEADAEAWVFGVVEARFGKTSPSLVRGGRERGSERASEQSEETRSPPLSRLLTSVKHLSVHGRHQALPEGCRALLGGDGPHRADQAAIFGADGSSSCCSRRRS